MSVSFPHHETLQSDLTSWRIGPYHPALPGAFGLSLDLDGEIMVDALVETGYLHRGIEKALEKQTWHALIPWVDHLDPEGAAFAELAVCLAVEELAGISVPQRAQAIRLLLCELTRIGVHLGFVARLARAAGSETLLHYTLRDRERIFDLLELLTGARFSIAFLRYGGVSADVTEGFIERVVDVCALLKVRLKEYNDLFTFNRAFVQRAAFVGVLHADKVQELGITGPNARASRVSFDVRKAHPYTGYQLVDFEVPLGEGDAGTVGDIHDRFLMRLKEIYQSVEILRQVAEMLPRGDFTNGKIGADFAVPSGEAYSRVESSRGLFGCHIVGNGTKSPGRIQFRTPTAAVMQVIPSLLSGHRLEDMPLILASLDLCIAEVDR